MFLPLEVIGSWTPWCHDMDLVDSLALGHHDAVTLVDSAVFGIHGVLEKIIHK